jgi:single-stranded DNA-binding protein
MYSTEVVLQKFGGEIRLLPKQDREEQGTVQRGEKAAAPTGRREHAPATGRYADLDDDIPF